MASVIVVFQKADDAKAIRNLLVRSGYDVNAVCTTGTQALASADTMNYGIVVSGYRYPDMVSSELHAMLPQNFRMIVVAGSRFWSDNPVEGITYLGMPIKVRELLDTLSEITAQQDSKRRRERNVARKRDDRGREIVQQAKHLLMDCRNMAEEDAYRYIQKTSMDSSQTMVETAQMIIELYGH